MIYAATILGSLILTAAGIFLYIKAVSGGRLLDIPNERSSHVNPTTRGAGIVIVLVFLIGYLIGGVTGIVKLDLGYLIGAVLVATIGFIDDIRSISVLSRLAIQFIAAIAFVASSTVPILNGPESVLLKFCFVIWIVGMTNAFNFMDGIDGIAGTQAIVAGFVWLVLGFFATNIEMSHFGGLIIGSSFGFLWWNWSPARVFMGDVGSTFLGFSLAGAPLLFNEPSSIPTSGILVATVLSLWLFLFDTVATRLMQIAQRKAFWRPHRDHYYQRLVINGLSHAKVSSYFGIVGLAIALSACAFILYGTGSWLPISAALLAAMGLPIWLAHQLRSNKNVA